MNKFELFFFDLDETLVESRSDMDSEMANLTEKLLEQKKVAIISGADFPQFKKQVIDRLSPSANLKNLYIVPLTGGSFYTLEKKRWEEIYDDNLSKKEKEKIIDTLKKVISENDFLKPEKIFGKQIQDREGQITFSALGDKAPIELKKVWDPDYKKRKKIKEMVDKDLAEFEISIGGSTSIDIRRKGIDKAYGINKVSALLSIPKNKIIFIGNAIFKGGNDYSATETGVHIKKVSGPEETKEFLKKYLKKNYK
ncbi:HAD-IIB family hydrolase [Patescibacteria group bacterium]|nr:HAD-IIB family hydrolase [Patescibacteria group bacterium]MCG2695282.1 HAD-IIB family hydrolase [Candidatus Parcubacteria bacterium]